MNASPLLPLAGSASNSPPTTVPEKTPGSVEGAFADTLSAALSGSPVQPFALPPHPVATGLAIPARPLFHDAMAESGTSRPEAIIGGGTSDLTSGLVTQLLEAGLKGRDGLSGADLPIQDALSGAQSVSQGALSGSRAPDVNSEAGPKQSSIQTATPETAKNASPVSTIHSGVSQQSPAASILPLPASSLPASATSQPITGIGLANRTSAIALATTVVPTSDGSARAEKLIPELRQSLASRPDRQGAGDIGNSLPSRSNQGHFADPAEAAVHRTTKSSPDQGTRQPIQLSTLLQYTSEQINEPLSNAAHLAKVRSESVNLQNAGIALAPSKPITTAAVQNFQATEAIGIDTQSNADPVEVFSSEIGRLDPAGASGSKPSMPSAQPPNTQIALHIARAVPQGIDRFSLQLHPADLGAVEIQLDFTEDGRVTAAITVERPETLDLLQRDSRALERSLNDTGLQLESDGLSFSLKQEQNQQGQGFDTSSQQRSNPDLGGRAHDGNEDAMPEQAPVHTSRQRLLDIRT